MSQKNTAVSVNDRINLLNLGWSFLKIGSTSFGGYMALVSMLETDLVEKKSWIKDDQIVEAIAIASFLPGPLAVNISAYIGFQLRGWLGGTLAFLGVLLPSFFLITLLTHLYFDNIQIGWVSSFFVGVMPAIVAIIMKVGLGMWKKTVTSYYQYLIIVSSILIGLLVKGISGILMTMIISGFVSYLLETGYYSNRPKRRNRVVLDFNTKDVLIPGLLLLLGFVTLEVVSFDSVYWEMAHVFSTMSITLFGGGYVFIPMMQQIIVDQRGWLSSQEFSDAIAMGQITPGPILISAAFVGFKLKGIVGAAVSTMSIFLPSAILMLVIGQLYKGISDNPHVILVFKGVKTAIIGLILFSAITITYNSSQYVYVALLGLVCLGALNKFSINPILLILLSGMLGIFVFQ